MADYYYLLTSLPTIELFSKPPLDFYSFFSLLQMNLTKKDLQTVEEFLRYYDLLNLRAFWEKKPLDPWGNLDEAGLEEALLVETTLPDFVFEFLKNHETPEEKLLFFPSLLHSFYQWTEREKKGFFQKFFSFEKKVRLITSQKKIEKEGLDREKELFFIDFKDPQILEIVQKVDSYEDVEVDFRPLSSFIEENYEEPLSLLKGLLEFEFNYIADKFASSTFSLDAVLQYLVMLRLATEAETLSQEEGQKIIDQIA